MEQDQIISEVRRVREELSARFDNDLDKLFAHFKEQEKKSKEKFIDLPRRKKTSSPK